MHESDFVEFIHKVDKKNFILFIISYIAVFSFFRAFMLGAILLPVYFLGFMFYDFVQHKKFGKTIAYLFVTFIPVLTILILHNILRSRGPDGAIWVIMWLLTIVSFFQILSSVQYKNITAFNANSLDFFVIQIMSFFVAGFATIIYFTIMALFIAPILSPITFSVMLLLCSPIFFILPFVYFTYFMETTKKTVHEQYFANIKIGKLNGVLHQLFRTDYAHPKKEIRYISKIATTLWIFSLIIVFTCYVFFSLHAVTNIEEQLQNNIHIPTLVQVDNEVLDEVLALHYTNVDKAYVDYMQEIEIYKNLGIKRYFMLDNPKILTSYIFDYQKYLVAEKRYQKTYNQVLILMLFSDEQLTDIFATGEFMQDEIFRVQKELQIEHGIQEGVGTSPVQMVRIFDDQTNNMFSMVGNVLEESTTLKQELEKYPQEVEQQLEEETTKTEDLLLTIGEDKGYFFYAQKYEKEFRKYTQKFCPKDTCGQEGKCIDEQCVVNLAVKLGMPQLCQETPYVQQENCFMNFVLSMDNVQLCTRVNDIYYKKYEQYSIAESKSRDFLEACIDFYNENTPQTS